MTTSRKLLVLIALLAFSSIQFGVAFAGDSGGACSAASKSSCEAKVKTADATANSAGKSCAATCSVAEKQACMSKMASAGPGQVSHLTLGVAYLSCNGCAGKVSSALKEVNGVQSVAVDYRTGVADVEFDANASGSDELIKAVEKAGYHAQIGPYSDTELAEFAKAPAEMPAKGETSKSSPAGN